MAQSDSLCELRAQNFTVKINHVPFIVGGDSKCSFQLSDVPEVAFSIVQSGDRYLLASCCKMTVDGLCVNKHTPRIPLFNNSLIEISRYSFQFCYSQIKKFPGAHETVQLKYQMIRRTLE